MEAINRALTAGGQYGRWTVLHPADTPGERRWTCRCACGTERDVLERSLKSGGSLSCGCLRRENAQKANEYDLQGKVFGRLHVLGRAERRRKNGGVYWLCRCACGQTCEAAATLLTTGKRTHCGCGKQAYSRDVAGRRFARLTALYPTGERDVKGYVIWHCRCECGREADVSYNALMYSQMKSCGCCKQEHNQAMSGFLTHVDGTSLDILRSMKIPSNNTTGVKGVYRIKGKYVAKIVFQKKQYLLGTFEALEQAAQARREAEAAINQTVVRYYAAWKRRADADAQWAQENPVRIAVGRNASGRLTLTCSPKLEEQTE